jgi:anti-sigma-K factor RskA
MSKRLEDFVKTNREEFDEIEPSADLWSRIEKELPAQYQEPKKRETKTFSLGFVMRVAATVIVVMGIGFAAYLHSTKKEGIDFAAINPVYAQQQIQYTSLIETKRTELKSIAKTDPALYKEFSLQIAKMDSTYKQLNSDLATSPNQERVLHAMIRNLQIQTEVLNQQLNVIEQFNQMKKEQNNETKNI